MRGAVFVGTAQTRGLSTPFCGEAPRASAGASGVAPISLTRLDWLF